MIDNLISIKYKTEGDTLSIITVHDVRFNYKIIKKDDDQMIIASDDKVYYLKRIFKIDDDKLFFKNDTDQLYNKPTFNKPLFDYLINNISNEIVKILHIMFKLNLF